MSIVHTVLIGKLFFTTYERSSFDSIYIYCSITLCNSPHIYSFIRHNAFKVQKYILRECGGAQFFSYTLVRLNALVRVFRFRSGGNVCLAFVSVKITMRRVYTKFLMQRSAHRFGPPLPRFRIPRYIGIYLYGRYSRATPDEMLINDKILTTCIKTIKIKVDSKSEIVLFKASCGLYMDCSHLYAFQPYNALLSCFIISIASLWDRAMHTLFDIDTILTASFHQFYGEELSFILTVKGRNA